MLSDIIVFIHKSWPMLPPSRRDMHFLSCLSVDFVIFIKINDKIVISIEVRKEGKYE